MITRFASTLAARRTYVACTRRGLPATLATMALLTAGCATNTLNFATMSEEELYAYNLDQPLMKRVLCREERTTSSFIRKRRCATVEELVAQNTDSVLALDVLNYGVNFNAGISGGRD